MYKQNWESKLRWPRLKTAKEIERSVSTNDFFCPWPTTQNCWRSLITLDKYNSTIRFPVPFYVSRDELLGMQIEARTGLLVVPGSWLSLKPQSSQQHKPPDEASEKRPGRRLPAPPLRVQGCSLLWGRSQGPGRAHCHGSGHGHKLRSQTVSSFAMAS